MNATARLFLVAVLMFLVDLPWLSLIGGQYNAVIKSIQGGAEVRMRPIAGLVVYPALAYLALRTDSLQDAFWTGLCVYAVYDFTVLAVFEKYPVYLSILDSLWGSFLFMVIWFIRDKFLKS